MKTYHNEADTNGITKIALKFFFEFEIEKKSSDTQYFYNQVQIDRG